MYDKLSQFYEDSLTSLKFYVNSTLKQIETVNANQLLLDYLRDNGYTGTKLGCGEGGCGACTVVIAEYDANTKLIKYRTANSCLLPLCAVHNKQVITVEGIGCPERPHPVQVNKNVSPFYFFSNF
jgi:xanthine dehydrogenase/oxidase